MAPPRILVAPLVAVGIFVLALVVRFGFWSEIRGTALDRWHQWEQTDMATYLEQARLFEEDWLGSEPYHPYHGWQEVAPPEKWLEWYGEHAFHQAPGYSWILAMANQVADAHLKWIKRVQIVLGAGTCVLLFLIAHRLGGTLAGTVAGLLGAVYAPLLYLEPQILREGPAIFAQLVILLILMRHVQEREWSPARIVGSAVGIGGCIGLFHVFHEMGSVLLATAAIALFVRHARKPKFAAGLLAMLAVGYSIGFAPLLARNVFVGAPLFQVSCRTHVNFAQANEPAARQGGATFSVPGPNVVEILDAGRGSLPRTALATWRAYDGDAGLALSNLGRRFAVIWQRFEEADNTSLYFYRDMTESLDSLPDFRIAFPAGFGGALIVLLAPLLLAARRRLPAGFLDLTEEDEPGPALTIWLRAPRAHLVLLLHLALTSGALSLVHSVARFRLYLVPYFLIYAGILVAICWDSIERRRYVLPITAAALVFLGWAAQLAMTSDWSTRTARPADFGTAINLSLPHDDFDTALAAAEVAARITPRDPTYYRVLGRYKEDRREYAEAVEYYGRALQINPRIRYLQEDLNRALRLAKTR